MRSAPAVRYPVGRSRFQAGLLALLGLTGASIALMWRDRYGTLGWSQAVFAITFMGAWTVGVVGWLRSPYGCLRWDGENWSWHGVSDATCTNLKVHLDLQMFLLVSVVLGGGGRLWLWPERGADVRHWRALRRAVFFCKPARHSP